MPITIHDVNIQIRYAKGIVIEKLCNIVFIKFSMPT